MDLNTAPMPATAQAAQNLSPNILPLDVRNLVFAPKGVALINDISFALQPGPKTVILGTNGAGKSLTLRLCHGLLKPTSGTITWNAPATGEPATYQAMVFQRPVLLRRTVAANVDYGLKLRHIPKARRRHIIDDVLSRTGLARFASAPARLLSGGEQQKLALARAWALRPQVLFLDEPTASLDPAATNAVEDIVLAMHAEGTRIVMTTHNLAEARRMADEILFLHKGRLLEHTDASAFFDAPKSGEAAAFLRGELRW